MRGFALVFALFASLGVRAEDVTFRVSCLNVGHYEVFDPAVAKEKYETEWKRFFAENPADNIVLSPGLEFVDFRIPTRTDYVLSTDHRPILVTVRLRDLTAD